MKFRKIIASAIMFRGVVFTGVRHNEIIKDINRLTNGYDGNIAIQGFIDQMNVFYDRKQAKEIVLNSKQHYKKIASTLTSEELW